MRPPNAIFTAPLRPGRNGRSWPGFRDAPEGTGDSHLQEPIRDHLFGYQQAFAHPLSVTIVVGVLVGLAVSGTLIVALRRLISETSYADAFRRWRSWCWLVGVIFLPVLAGALWTMLALSLIHI